MIRPPPTSTLFPYTALFRSGTGAGRRRRRRTLPAVDDFAVGCDGVRGDRKSTRLNSSHEWICRMPSSVFNDPATTDIYTLSLHGALPIWDRSRASAAAEDPPRGRRLRSRLRRSPRRSEEHTPELQSRVDMSYAVFCF